MKTKNNNGLSIPRYLKGILGALAVVTAALALSCEQPDASPAGAAPAGKGVVAISVSPGSPAGSVLKTVLPTEFPAFSKYDLTFTPKGGDPQDPVTVTPAQIDGEGDDDVTFELAVGDWTVAVTAYMTVTKGTPPVDTPYPAAKGEAEFTLAPQAEPEPVAVTVQPIPITDEETTLKGFFTYTVGYPAGSSGTLKVKDGETDLTTVTLASGAAASTVGPLTVELAPGYYTLVVNLEKGDDGPATGVSRKLHVYAGLESTYEYEFTDADFVEKVYLTGTIPTPPAPVAAYALADVKVYSDAGYTTAVTVTEAALAAGVWSAAVPAANIGKALYIKAEKDSSVTTIKFTSKASVEALPEAGVDLGAFGPAALTGTGSLADVKTVVEALTATGEPARKKANIGDLSVTKHDTSGNNTKTLEGVDVTVIGTASLAAGTALTFNNASKLTVADGGTLALAAGTTDPKVDGAKLITNYKADTATFTVNAGGKVTVANGATLTVPDVITFGADVAEKTAAQVAVDYGATLTYGLAGKQVTISPSTGSGAFLWKASTDVEGGSKVTLKSAGVELSSGELSVKAAGAALAVDAPALVVAKDATLKVPANGLTLGAGSNLVKIASGTVTGGATSSATLTGGTSGEEAEPPKVALGTDAVLALVDTGAVQLKGTGELETGADVVLSATDATLTATVSGDDGTLNIAGGTIALNEDATGGSLGVGDAVTVAGAPTFEVPATFSGALIGPAGSSATITFNDTTTIASYTTKATANADTFAGTGALAITTLTGLPTAASRVVFNGSHASGTTIGAYTTVATNPTTFEGEGALTITDLTGADAASTVTFNGTNGTTVGAYTALVDANATTFAGTSALTITTLTDITSASKVVFNGPTTITGAVTTLDNGLTIDGTGAVTLAAKPTITNGLTVTNTTGVTIPSVDGVASKSIDASAGKVIFGTATDSVAITKGTLKSGANGLAGAATDGAVTLGWNSSNSGSLALAAGGSIAIAGTGSVTIGDTAVLKGAGSTWTAGTDTVTFAATGTAAGKIEGGTSATLTPTGANAELYLLAATASQALTIGGTTKFTLDLSAAGKITFDPTTTGSTITLTANTDGIKLSNSLAIVGTATAGNDFTGAFVDGTNTYNADTCNVSLVDGVITHSSTNAAAPLQIDRTTTAESLASAVS